MPDGNKRSTGRAAKAPVGSCCSEARQWPHGSTGHPRSTLCLRRLHRFGDTGSSSWQCLEFGFSCQGSPFTWQSRQSSQKQCDVYGPCLFFRSGSWKGISDLQQPTSALVCPTHWLLFNKTAETLIVLCSSGARKRRRGDLEGSPSRTCRGQPVQRDVVRQAVGRRAC